MTRILTIATNPSIDVSTFVDPVIPSRNLRSWSANMMRGARGRCRSAPSALSAPATVSTPRWSHRSPPASRWLQHLRARSQPAPPPGTQLCLVKDIEELEAHLRIDALS